MSLTNRFLAGLLRLCMSLSGGALLLLAGEARFHPGGAILGESAPPLAMAAGGALLLAGQFWIGFALWRLRREREAFEQDRFELAGLQGLVGGLKRDRDLVQAELERLRGEQELSRAAKAHESLEEFIATLAALIAKSLAGAQELTIFQVDEERVSPRAHYQRIGPVELFLAFTPEGGALLGEAMRTTEDLPARRFGIKNVAVETHGREFRVAAALGFILPDRSRRAVGDVKLVLPRPHPEAELSRAEAAERLKSEVARVQLESAGVDEALKRPMMQRLDQRRGVLELACRLGAGEESYGVVKAGFETSGVEVDAMCRIWQPLLADAAKHIARAIRTHGFQMRAVKDGLTGLYNKSFFLERLDAVFAGARAGADLSLIMVDIDHFKKVNDTYGHLTGDRVLQAVAGVLASAARASDTVFRYGGEEMGFLLAGEGARKALALANRVRQAVEATVCEGEKGESLRVTISLGVARYAPEMEGPRELIQRADEALYVSKENGRNQVTAWSGKRTSTRA